MPEILASFQNSWRPFAFFASSRLIRAQFHREVAKCAKDRNGRGRTGACFPVSPWVKLSIVDYEVDGTLVRFSAHTFGVFHADWSQRCHLVFLLGG